MLPDSLNNRELEKFYEVEWKTTVWVSNIVITADETNIVSEQLKHNWSVAQNVDGSVTPVLFSSTPVPAWKIFLAQRILFYMEWQWVFDSNTFAHIPPLTNWWELLINWVVAMSADTNRKLAQYMFDMQWVEIFWKLDRTMIWRFSFNKIVDWASWITIREWETIATKVNDDLSTLAFLEVMVQWIYKDKE